MKKAALFFCCCLILYLPACGQVISDFAEIFSQENLPRERVLKETAPREAPPVRVEKGRLLFGQFCGGCHNTHNREPRVGPGLEGLFKREKLPMSGRAATAANIRIQIRTPFRYMPRFPQLTEQQIGYIIDYLKTL